MKSVNRLLLAVLIAQYVIASSPAHGQTKTQEPESKAATSDNSDPQKKNVEAYIDLLRKDVRQEKAEIMGTGMV